MISLSPFTLPATTLATAATSSAEFANFAPDLLPFHQNVTLTVSLSVGSPHRTLPWSSTRAASSPGSTANTTRIQQPAFDPTRSKSYSPVSCSSLTCTTRTRDFSMPAFCDPNNLCHAVLSMPTRRRRKARVGHGQRRGSEINETVLGCMDSGFSSNPDEDSKTTGLMGMNRGAGQTMVDSGTQFTFLLGPVYTALRNEFLNQTARSLRVLDDPDFIFQGAMDLCYLVPPGQPGLSKLPTVSLVFQGAEMRVSGDGLLYRVSGEVRGNDSVYCFTFGNSDLLGIEAYVIGHHHQQNVWMEFDLEKSRIGLAQTGMVDWGYRVMVVLAGSRPLNQLTASNGDPLIERWSIVGSEMSI
ncbi:eukaryotic aspartyl protease family protein [Actinidia rufa]|uniref:Eukaryotic aspartyl protease family protein n=1 Tax=Actinidia rufa TaxID=165716 RepID=A0A7J0F3N2_9ERIC|nr:eukaryotic aspartyl protease family protein [Actinidia rufa]